MIVFITNSIYELGDIMINKDIKRIVSKATISEKSPEKAAEGKKSNGD